MNLIKLCLTIVVSLSAFACATTKSVSEPSPGHGTLVLAALTLHGEGYDSVFGVPLSGTITNNIDLEVRDDDDNGYKLSTDMDSGLAFSNQIPAGKYYLASIYYSGSDSDGNWVHLRQQIKHKIYFTVTAGQVNVLGNVLWSESITKEDVDQNGMHTDTGMVTTTGWASSLQVTPDIDSVWQQFLKRYPKTGWATVTTAKAVSDPVKITMSRPDYAEIAIPGVDLSN